MKYNNNWIKEKYANGEQMEYLFFWGHQSKNKDQIDETCLSQWFETEFEYEKIIYPTAEHWMMAEKARLFGDEESFEKIVNCFCAKEVKAIGGKVKGFKDSIWLSNREEIVKNGNYLKFKQNKDLWDYLDGTGEKVLVEASPYDKIWGIGMKSKNSEILNPNNWKGLNLLGFALMEVRNKLRNEM